MGLTDTKFLGKLCLSVIARFVQISYLLNLNVAEPRVSVSLATIFRGSSFRSHIRHVIDVGSDS